MKPLKKKVQLYYCHFLISGHGTCAKTFVYQSYIATVVSEVWGKSGNVDFLAKCAEFETNAGL